MPGYGGRMRGLSWWQIDAPATGFPRLDGDLRADAVVVGAGVTGLACARRLAEAGMGVVVLDARSPGAGASGRNGGFAVAGTELGFRAAAERLGADLALSVHRATEAALGEMVALAAAEGSDAVRLTGSMELAAPGAEEDELRAEVAAMTAAGIRAELAAVPERLAGAYALAAHVPGDGETQPAEWIGVLARAAAAAGADVREHAPVRAVRAAGGGWEAVTPAGTVRAPVAVVACDGLTAALVPELRGVTYPVRGQMLATEPAGERVLTLPTHSDGGFMYYRQTEDGRIVIGGMRDAAAADELTAVERTTPEVQAAIERFVRERLRVDAPAAHRWAGIMGFSTDLLPVAGAVPGRTGLHAAAGYSGVGNVQGFLCGGLLADGILSRPHPLADIYAPSRLVHERSQAALMQGE